MREDHLSYHTHPIPSRPPAGGPSPSRVSTPTRTGGWTHFTRRWIFPSRRWASPRAGGHPILIFFRSADVRSHLCGWAVGRSDVWPSPTFFSTGTGMLYAFPTTSEPFGFPKTVRENTNPSLSMSCINVGGMEVEGDPEPCPPTWPKTLHSSWISGIISGTQRQHAGI